MHVNFQEHLEEILDIMFILNQIVGIGDFSIIDNLRLIVIAIIFISIIVVLLYLKKSAKSERKTENEYMQATNLYGSGSKEEEIEEKKDKDIVETAAEIREKSVISLESIEAKIKIIEDEISTKIEELILKIEEREKEVVDKIKNIIDIKVKEALNKMNDGTSDVLQAQKNSTVKTENRVEKKIDHEETEGSDLETPVKDKDIIGELVSSLPIMEGPVSVSSSDESKSAASEDVIQEEIREEQEKPSEVEKEVKLEVEEPTASSEIIEESILEVDEGDSADFDIQEFLDEHGDLPSEKDLESEK